MVRWWRWWLSTPSRTAPAPRRGSRYTTPFNAASERADGLESERERRRKREREDEIEEERVREYVGERGREGSEKRQRDDVEREGRKRMRRGGDEKRWVDYTERG